MALGQLFTISALALITGLYVHDLDTSQSLRIPGLSADILATANFTNDLVHYAQVLQSSQLQDFNLATGTSSFDDDYAIVTIGHIDSIFKDTMQLSTSVDFSDCEPLFDKLWYYRPDDQSPNEADEAALQAIIERFVHGTAIGTVKHCIKSMAITVQQHAYLRKLHGATSHWVRKVASTDLSTRNVDIGDRSHKLTAGVTYLSIMLDIWMQETAGLREFLVDLEEMLWEENAKVVKDAAPRTGLFGELKNALMAYFLKWRFYS
jgi:hypothetical protein